MCRLFGSGTEAASGDQTLNVDIVFGRDRNPVKGTETVLSGVGGLGLIIGTFDIYMTKRIQCRVPAFDPIEIGLDDVDGGHLLLRELRRQDREIPLRDVVHDSSRLGF